MSSVRARYGCIVWSGMGAWCDMGAKYCMGAWHEYVVWRSRGEGSSGLWSTLPCTALIVAPELHCGKQCIVAELGAGNFHTVLFSTVSFSMCRQKRICMVRMVAYIVHIFSAVCD